MNLNEHYNTIRSQLHGESVMPTLQSVFSCLQSASLTLCSPSMDLKHFTMVARDSGKGKKSDQLCDFCGK